MLFGLSWTVFGTIMSHPGIILGPFLDPFGANFQVDQVDFVFLSWGEPLVIFKALQGLYKAL